jgi:arylsulfatase A-like enzyme
MRWVALMLAVWAGSPGVAHAAPPQPHIVLISLDTTRADALSCYGQPAEIRRRLPPWTPNIDALAAQGLRFERFYAHAPTTLNSHSSMLTGLDPHQHGVPRNGYPLPDGVPTLSSRLGEAGYQTIGVVGASALAADMGVGRGFDVWDDRVDRQPAKQFEDLAEGVVDRALEDLDAADPDRPLFLFVHMFDAHAPYDAPRGWREHVADSSYKGPFQRVPSLIEAYHRRDQAGRVTAADADYVASRYLSEVAYMDDQVGRLLTELRNRGYLEQAVVVVTADHGESLTELAGFTWSHGYDVSDGSLRVPLIVRAYGVALGGPAVVRRQAGMASLAPTLERIAGLPRTLGTHPDLWDHVRPGPVWDFDGWPSRPTHTVPHEATRPHVLEAPSGWNNLAFRRAIRAGGAVARSGLRGRQPLQVTDGPAGLLPVLAELVRLWDAAAPPRREDTMTDATRAALEALGYLGGSEQPPGEDGSAP